MISRRRALGIFLILASILAAMIYEKSNVMSRGEVVYDTNITNLLASITNVASAHGTRTNSDTNVVACVTNLMASAANAGNAHVTWMFSNITESRTNRYCIASIFNHRMWSSGFILFDISVQ